MSRCLRFALLLAALVAAGPMPSARTVETARAHVSIAWFLGDRASHPETRTVTTAIPRPSVVRNGFHAYRHPVLSHALHLHSLFQRPPPLQN